MVKRVLKIYIAGPMTGYPDYNRAAFNAKASELMAEGHIVLISSYVTWWPLSE